MLKLNPHYNRIRRWSLLTVIRPRGSTVMDEISTFSLIDGISTLIKGLEMEFSPFALPSLLPFEDTHSPQWT